MPRSRGPESTLPLQPERDQAADGLVAIPSSDELAAVSCQHIENRDVYYVNGPKNQRKKIAD
jgi:hypothetical protein